MQRQITTNISVISAFAVAISGLCVEQALAGGSDCTTGSVVEVCVEWSQGINTVEGTHYFVDFMDASNPDVDLKTADLAWVVYATLVSNGDPANIGTLTLRDPTPAGEDFEVKIANRPGAGAANVGSIILNDAGFTGYSSIEGSFINGDLTGDLLLKKDSGGNGGVVHGLTIGGDASGDISVYVVKSFLINGDLSGGAIDINDELDGKLSILGNTTSAAIVAISDMVSGSKVTLASSTTTFDGFLLLANGIPANTTVKFLGDITSTADIHLNGGDVAGQLHVFADNAGDVLSGGEIKTLNGADFGGDLRISNDVVGDISVSNDMTSASSVSLGGALANGFLTGGGRILVSGESSGDIEVGKNTGSHTLIQVAKGLATVATIQVNTTRSKFDAAGDIHIGPGVLTPGPLPFDGCIRIYDNEAGAGGALDGDIDIVACHDPAGEILVICIDGDVNGNVTLVQTDCDGEEATWGCEDPPDCP